MKDLGGMRVVYFIFNRQVIGSSRVVETSAFFWRFLISLLANKAVAALSGSVAEV